MHLPRLALLLSSMLLVSGCFKDLNTGTVTNYDCPAELLTKVAAQLEACAKPVEVKP